MKPLIVLLTVFGLSVLITRFIRGHYEFALPARIALSAMLVFTAIGHFAFTEGMSMMIPPRIPYKTEIVYLSGIFEIAAAIGLLVRRVRLTTAWLLIAFFIMILPANIYAALKHIDYQQASFDGPGPNYLWFRVPLQLFFIGWAYLSTIRPNHTGLAK